MRCSKAGPTGVPKLFVGPSAFFGLIPKGELRNKANLRRNGLSRLGLERLRLRLVRGLGGGLGGFFFPFGGLEAGEVLEGVLEVALEGVDAALDALKDVAAVFENVGFGFGTVDEHPGVSESGFPEAGFDVAHAAEEPIAMDADIDQGLGLGGLRVPAELVLFDEGLEFGLVFTGNDLGVGVNAGLQGIEADGGFTGGGAWAGGFAGVYAIGFELFL